jgi:hypothetical protein
MVVCLLRIDGCKLRETKAACDTHDLSVAYDTHDLSLLLSQFDFWSEMSQRVPDIAKLSSTAAAFVMSVLGMQRDFETMLTLQPRSAVLHREYAEFEEKV